MKYTHLTILFCYMALAFAGCKKKDTPIVVSMDATIESPARTFHASTITAENDVSNVTIHAMDNTTNQNITLYLRAFNFSKESTYQIVFSGTGNNPDESMATYGYDSYLFNGQSGNVHITKISSRTISGTFQFNVYYAGWVQGSFVVARPN